MLTSLKDLVTCSLPIKASLSPTNKTFPWFISPLQICVSVPTRPHPSPSNAPATAKATPDAASLFLAVVVVVEPHRDRIRTYFLHKQREGQPEGLLPLGARLLHRAGMGQALHSDCIDTFALRSPLICNSVKYLNSNSVKYSIIFVIHHLHSVSV